MKLYYSPGACSLASHIALYETGLPFEVDRLIKTTKMTTGGEDFMKINPKGYVPAIKLDDGSVLTEGTAIVQYIADQAPASKLAPAAGTLERYRLMEWLNYITSEMHKSFSPLFNPQASDELKAMVRDALAQRFDYLSIQLQGNPYLMGETFTVADGYLFTVLGWTVPTQIDLSKWPVLSNYTKLIAARPAVRAAMQAEGLVK